MEGYGGDGLGGGGYCCQERVCGGLEADRIREEEEDENIRLMMEESGKVD